MTPQIRWMIRKDMQSVLAIESASYEHPWTHDEFIACLKQRNAIGMVGEIDEQVVAFMIYELHKTRLELIKLAVAQAFRRLDIGTAMIERLVNKLSQQRRQKITLRIGEGNLCGQQFFRDVGFKAVGVERGFFVDGQDAYRMELCPFAMDVADADREWVRQCL